MTLPDLLFDGPGDDDEVLVHLGASQTTRGELRASARELLGALQRAGLPRRVAMGVMLPNGAPLVAAIFAVQAADATYVPLNPRISDRELVTVVESLHPAVIVTDTPERVPADIARAVLTAGGGWTVTGTIDPAAPTLGEDIAFVQFTSGTTGRPKPVPLRGATVTALMEGVVAKLRGGRAAPTDRPPMPNLIPLSLSLWAGIYNVLFAFAVGAPVVLMSAFETTEFARLVREFGIRSVVLPPAAMTMLADDEAVTDLTPLRLVRSVSAPLSPLQARRFRQRFGTSVLNGYGQTELGGEVIGWSAADARTHGDDKLGSIGRPHDNIEVRVVGEGGAELPPDEVGELWIRTPATSAATGDSALADRLSPDGYLRSGDLARIDPDGFVWIEGRESDMINRGGLKVFPAEVVEVLLLHPRVRDAAVVGVPDDRVGEVPWAFVVGPEPVDADALRDHCRHHLAPYKLPVEIVGLPDLPRNELGKVVPRQLLEVAARRRAEPRGRA
jgi:long-chain acyl-CoA synthetase